MESVYLHKVRKEIKKQVCEWFNKRLHIEERAMQVLELVQYCQDGWIDDMETFEGVLKFQPAVTNLLLRTGVKKETFKNIISDAHKLSTFNLDILESVEDLNINYTLDNTFQSEKMVTENEGRGSNLRS